MLPRGRDIYAGVSKHDEQSPWQRAGEGPRSRAYVQRHAGQGDQGAAQKWEVVLCLQPEMCDGVGRSSREMVQETGIVTLILGLLSMVCILYMVKNQRVLGRGVTQPTITSLRWLCGRWIAESQTGDKEGSCYELYLEGPHSLKVPCDPLV